jgi:hypothetical protein
MSKVLGLTYLFGLIWISWYQSIDRYPEIQIKKLHLKPLFTFQFKNISFYYFNYVKFIENRVVILKIIKSFYLDQKNLIMKQFDQKLCEAWSNIFEMNWKNSNSKMKSLQNFNLYFEVKICKINLKLRSICHCQSEFNRHTSRKRSGCSNI